jgi:RNA polymerase II elongation factor ELL
MPLPIAVNGTISLQGSARQGDAPQPLTKRAMIVRLSEETLEALAAYPAHPPLQFEFGDTSVRTHTPPLFSLYPSSPSSRHLRVSTSDPPSSPCMEHKNLLRTNFTFAPL